MLFKSFISYSRLVSVFFWPTRPLSETWTLHYRLRHLRDSSLSQLCWVILYLSVSYISFPQLKTNCSCETTRLCASRLYQVNYVLTALGIGMILSKNSISDMIWQGDTQQCILFHFSLPMLLFVRKSGKLHI